MRLDYRLRPSAAAALTAWIGGIALARWLPPLAVAGAAAASFAAIAFAWERLRRPVQSIFAVLLGLPLHLVLLASGGLDSPVQPLLAGWVLLIAGLSSARRATRFAALAVPVLFGAAWWASGRLSLSGALSALTALAAGSAGAWVFEYAHRGMRRRERRLDRILREARVEQPSTPETAAAQRLIELELCVEEVRTQLLATRAVLWDIADETAEAVPRVVAGGRTPPRVLLAGDALGWAWQERVAMQLSEPSRWAPGTAAQWIVPVDGGGRGGLLTFDFPPGPVPAQGDVHAAADRCSALLRLDRLRADAAASEHRASRMLVLLRRLARDIDLPEYSRELAEAGRELAGGTGAAVGIWNDTEGEVVAAIGEDGGPRPGMTFGPTSELGVVARNGGPIQREFAAWERRRIPMATADERWFTPPRSLVVHSLEVRREEGAVGALAVWSSRGPLDPEGLEAVAALIPYAGQQLRNASAYRALRERAERDGLTGLHNRRAFDLRMVREVDHFGRYRRPISLILLDVDHFKQINDLHGHEAGDAVLRMVSDVLRAGSRGTDFAARFGGEEFVVLMPETNLKEAGDAAERLRLTLENRSIEWGGTSIRVRASFGVTCCPDCVPDPTRMVGSADAMLYASKSAGRNRVTAAPPVPAGG